MSFNFRDYLTLSKPKVVLLMLLTVWAGMYLGAQQTIPLWLWINTTAGIALMSGAAATLNHIIDYRIDAIMSRTKNRPLPKGKLSLSAACYYALIQGLVGFIILLFGVNKLTALLTLVAAVIYSAIYSIYLKRNTSQNIVIGGISGAMPPLLGWTAVSNAMDIKAWLLVLIIFTWTPAHFWALCLHRINEYKKISIPMLPITHGIHFTKLNIIFYSVLTFLCSLLPYFVHMSGTLYLISAILLGLGFIFYAVKLYVTQNMHAVALQTFKYSLLYLTGLFLFLLLDHHMIQQRF